MVDNDTKQPESAYPSSSGAATPPPAKEPGLDASLPPVEAPNAGFLLQLFLIPLVIVSIIIVVCLMLSWVAHMGNDAKDLARDLKKLNEGSWQKAFSLSTMLRDPKWKHLKDDEELAQTLIEVLDGQLDQKSKERPSIMLQIYLCRALGEFRVSRILPVLIKAGQPKDHAEADDVRFAALQALAVASHGLVAAGAIKPEELQDPEGDLMKLLLDLAALDETNDELRYQATYALGVVGGADANKRLKLLLGNADINTRYNAATGLARQGDDSCRHILMEMLDPNNEAAVEDEKESMKLRKQVMVMMNGIRATVLLAQQAQKDNKQIELEPLAAQLKKLESSNIQDIRYAAVDARVELERLSE